MVAVYVFFEREAQAQAGSLQKNTEHRKTLLYKLIWPHFWIWRELEGSPGAVGSTGESGG